ncbi:MAG TPA: HAD-IA family hydrolase [Acidimicrobiia bacterium]|jgi:putative hydrolase of the HAD superfamily
MRAVLFDFGYTLFGHEPGPAVVRREAAALGVAVSAEEAVSIWGDIDAAASTPAELARGRDLDAAVWRSRWPVIYAARDAQVAGLGFALDRAFHDPAQWVPYADSASALATARAGGLRVGVASNTGWDIRPVFAAHGMIDLVDAFTLSYECGAVKPQPEFFAAACAALDAAPSATVIVGDDPTTDGRAREAGLAGAYLVDASTPLGAPHGLDSAVASILTPR